MYFIATSSLVSLFLRSLATPKLPAPKSLTTSYLSIIKFSTQLTVLDEKGANLKLKLKWACKFDVKGIVKEVSFTEKQVLSQYIYNIFWK